MTRDQSCAAFAADRLIHRGPLVEVLAAVKLGRYDRPDARLLIFENETGQEVDFDLRGSLQEVLERVKAQQAPKGPGRPRLGVESREVSLLPRHWAWLAAQPNGASAALRRLVDAASRHTDPEGIARAQRDAAYRVMSALAGNRPGFEEAARALFAGDARRFQALIRKWPADIRAHLAWLADPGRRGKGAGARVRSEE
jgi:hypothetical protein